MTQHTHDPAEGVYATDSDWVHAIEIREPSRVLYVSGTMGLDEAGDPGADVSKQLDLVWHNIRRILESADMSVDNICRVTSYLRDPAYAEENARARIAALHGRPVATTAIVATTLSEHWLVEIEVIAAT